MIRSFLLSTVILLAAACGEKTETNTAAAADAPQAESIDGATVPGDEASRSFATSLVRTNVTNFKPTDAAGAKFVYKTVDFRGDNTWEAAAEMSADGETIECRESGTWEMDAAESATTANMTWAMTKSTCAGRPDTDNLRLKVTVAKGEYTIVFR